MPLISVPIATGADDGWWEPASTTFLPTASTASMGRTAGGDIRSSWFRFQDVQIPSGMTIFTARIRFQSVFDDTTTACNLQIVAEDADNPSAVTSVSDANGRTRTTAVTNWDNVPAQSSGAEYVTVNFAPVLQEIIDRGGWASGNAVQLFIEDNGSDEPGLRRPAMFDHATFDEPVLEVLFGTTVQDTGWLDLATFAGNGGWLLGSPARAWTNASNAASSDDAYATRIEGSGTLSAALTATNASPAIPVDADILGIQFRAEASYLNTQNAQAISRVGLTKDGGTSLAGNLKFVGQVLTTTDIYYVWGGSSDLWDTTWTPAEVNAAGFGCGLNSTGAGGGGTTQIDHMQVRIHYSSMADLPRAADVSVALQALGIERNAGVSAALLAEGTRNADVSSALAALGLSRTADVSAALLAEASRNADIAAALQALGIERDADVASALQQIDIARTAGVSAAFNLGGSRDADVLVALLAELSRDAGVSVALLSLLNQFRDADVSVALEELGFERTAGVLVALNLAEFVGTRTARVTIALQAQVILAPGRPLRPPEFTIVFTGPLPDDATLVRMGLPSETALEFSSDLPGGWATASAGVVRPELRRMLNATDYQKMLLPQNLLVPAFAHGTIYDEGGNAVWEGRVSNRRDVGGEIRGVTLSGYGITALRDTRMPSGSGATTTASVVRRVVDASPLIEALEIAGPSVPWDWSEFSGQALYDVLEAVAETGDGIGWTWTVYSRALRFFSRTPPDQPDYVIPADETVDRDLDNENVYTRVILTYQDLVGRQRVQDVRSDEAEQRFGISRTLPLSGGQMTSSAAAAFARTELAKRTRVGQSVSVSRSWDRGLETLYGSRPIWRVRAGEWVQIGDSGDMQMIERVSYSQQSGQGSLELGQPVSSDARAEWRRLLKLETAVRTNRNVVTRTRA